MNIWNFSDIVKVVSRHVWKRTDRKAICKDFQCKFSILPPNEVLYIRSGFSSVAQSCPTLRPHELQHARPPCPSPTPGVHSDSVHRVSDAIQPSHPLSSPFPNSILGYLKCINVHNFQEGIWGILKDSL